MANQKAVRWQDGSYDPYADNYREIVTKKSYWDWVEGNMPADDDGIYAERYASNQDCFIAPHPTGQKHQSIVEIIAKEAVKTLTEKQQQAWELCRKRKLSEEEAANILGVTQQSIHERLLAGEKKFKEYCDTQKHRVATELGDEEGC